MGLAAFNRIRRNQKVTIEEPKTKTAKTKGKQKVKVDTIVEEQADANVDKKPINFDSILDEVE